MCNLVQSVDVGIHVSYIVDVVVLFVGTFQ